jgi:Predicted membrane protein (DUF2207)
MDLSPQDPQQLPPAVVAYLLNERKVSEAVFTRAVLALAEDGWLRIEPEDSGVPVVRINSLPAPDQLKQFEQLALDRVVQRTGNLPTVPLSALTSNEGADYAPWWKRFSDSVEQEARATGMITRGVRGITACSAPLGLSTGAGLATALATGSAGSGVGAGIMTLVACSIIVNRAGRPKLTAQGEAAVEWWRRHGGGFDGAVIADQVPPGALPSPNSPEALAAQGSAPLPDGYVWSSYGGRWRTVKVGDLDVPTWGKPIVAVLLGVFGVFFTLPAATVGHFAIGGAVGTLIAIAPLTLSGGLILGKWLPANRRRASIPKEAAFTGQVVKRWTYESGGEDSTTYYCCCIDDGASPEGLSFRIERSLYMHMRVGDIVFVEFNPRWHKVKQIRLSAPAPGPRT